MEFLTWKSYKKGGFSMKIMCFALLDVVGHKVSISPVTPNNQCHWLNLGKTPDFSPTQYVTKIHKVKDIGYLLIRSARLRSYRRFTKLFECKKLTN